MFTNTIYGPIKPSRFALRGIRFLEGEEGAAPAAPAAAKPETPKPAEPAQDTDWKAESRKWESRAKENANAAQRLAEIETANQTEAEKVAKRLAAAEKRAAELEVTALRATVAAAKGVPANLLSGSTQEELEAAADALIEFRGAKTDKRLVIPGEGKSPASGKGDGDLREFAQNLFNTAD